jgi:hypothetical protein
MAGNPFHEDVAEGMMVAMKLGDAKARCERLTLAALGALKKDSTGRSFRIIEVATNRVLVDHRIRAHDKLRYPTVGDLAAAVAEVASLALLPRRRHLHGAPAVPWAAAGLGLPGVPGR